jgi:transposase-like protein
MTKRTTYSKEFKVEAVRLLELGEKKPAELARELGVSRNKLYRWREQLTGKTAHEAFPGQGRRGPDSAELAALKDENARLKQEIEFLKKTAKFFAKESSATTRGSFRWR